MNHILKGAGVALITPFDEDNQVCYSSLDKLVEYQLENGADYLVVLGTTAETATLTPQEQEKALEFILDKNNGRVPVVLGIGGNNTHAVCEKIKTTKLDRVDAILSVTPYYNKPNQRGIIEHFKAIEAVSPVPIVLYNVPSRTGVDMTIDTVIELANYSTKFVAIKDGGGNLDKCMHISKEAPEHFIYLSGDDKNTLPLLSVGSQGVISVIMNATPSTMSRMVHHALDNKFLEAKELHNKLLRTMELIFEEGNPTGIKAALSSIGIIQNYLRLPLVEASEELYEKIENELNHSEIL